MDSVDGKILALLQANARLPIKDIAAEVGLSSPAVTARIDKLESEGYINGYHADISLQKRGYLVTAFINLEAEPVKKPEINAFICSCPNVLECCSVTGQYTMLMKVCFKSTMELDYFVGRIQRYGRTSTQVVFSTIVEHRGINILN